MTVDFVAMATAVFRDGLHQQRRVQQRRGQRQTAAAAGGSSGQLSRAQGFYPKLKAPVVPGQADAREEHPGKGNVHGQ